VSGACFPHVRSLRKFVCQQATKYDGHMDRTALRPRPATRPTPGEADTAARLRAVVGSMSRRLNAAARGSGMTPSQLSALGVLARRGPLRLSELADIEGANPTMLSRVVAALDEQRLVRRRPDPADRRAGLVEVTAKGRRSWESMRDLRGRLLLDALTTLDAGETAALQAALPALESLAAAVSRRERS
jgi:DNA-binding MarR family transcriptional regulator